MASESGTETRGTSWLVAGRAYNAASLHVPSAGCTWRGLPLFDNELAMSRRASEAEPGGLNAWTEGHRGVLLKEEALDTRISSVRCPDSFLRPPAII